MTIAAIRSPVLREETEKDAPLRDDIRLLGRILGDTVREQEGEETFQYVERIRQASIRFHRDNESGARRELAAILDSLDNDQTLAIVRAFSYFSHLANIAEDQHHIRRNRAHVVKRRRFSRREARAKLGQEARHRIVERDNALLDETHRRRGDERLGHRGEAEYVALAHRTAFLPVGEACRAAESERPSLGD